MFMKLITSRDSSQRFNIATAQINTDDNEISFWSYKIIRNDFLEPEKLLMDYFLCESIWNSVKYRLFSVRSSAVKCFWKCDTYRFKSNFRTTKPKIWRQKSILNSFNPKAFTWTAGLMNLTIKPLSNYKLTRKQIDINKISKISHLCDQWLSVVSHLFT